jgi:hypothetical protein
MPITVGKINNQRDKNNTSISYPIMKILKNHKKNKNVYVN